MKQELFEYYTSLKFKITDYPNKQRMVELNDLSLEDIKNERKARNKNQFQNDNEYQVYLSFLMDNAFRMELGLSTEYVTSEEG